MKLHAVDVGRVDGLLVVETLRCESGKRLPTARGQMECHDFQDHENLTMVYIRTMLSTSAVSSILCFSIEHWGARNWMACKVSWREKLLLRCGERPHEICRGQPSPYYWSNHLLTCTIVAKVTNGILELVMLVRWNLRETWGPLLSFPFNSILNANLDKIGNII